MTFGHADPLQGRAWDEALIRALVTNPRVMRQLPRLLRSDSDRGVFFASSNYYAYIARRP